MSEPRKPPSPEQRPPCPRCGSHNVQPKGERNNRWRYRCKDCRKWFQEDPLIELDHDDILDVFDAYCFDVTALDRINNHTAIAKMKEQGKSLPDSKTNWSDFLIEEAECLESGAEITRTRRGSMSGVLVIDSMHRKIEKEMHFTWIAIDSLKGDSIHYDVTANRKLPAILQFLFELKLLGGYDAIIAVCDLEPAIIAAVRLVFPNAKIQGCVVHRMRTLYKKLRTVKRNGKPIKNISPERLRVRTEFIELARKLIHSATPEEKQLLTELMKSREKEWELDHQTHQQYSALISKLKFYLTRQELGECPDNTNQCESANDLFSKFVDRRQGFKNLRAARAYLKAFFAVYRLKRNGTIGRKVSPYLLTQVQGSVSELQQPSDVISSPRVMPEVVPAMEVPQANTGAQPVVMEGVAKEDVGADTVAHGPAQSAEPDILNNVNKPESTPTHNAVVHSTKDEVLKVDKAELQKFKHTEAEILTMLSSADAYSLKSPKSYVNRFEIVARKLGVTPSSIAINKTDGSVTKLTNVKEKPARRCMLKSAHADCLSQLEFQCLANSAVQMADSLTGPYYNYSSVKSYANEFYHIIHRRGKSPASSTISKHDGQIFNGS